MKPKYTFKKHLLTTTFVLTYVVGLLMFWTTSIHANCVCELERTLYELDRNLPPETVTVSNVTELSNAVQQANMNGNLMILLEKGTYILSQPLYIKKKNVAFRGRSGNRDDVVIRGDGMEGSISHIFDISASYFTIADMTIGWVSTHIIQIHGEFDADYPLVHNVRAVDAGEQLFKVSGANQTTGSDHGLVEWSVFEYSAGVGPQGYIGGLVAINAHDWIVRNNVFRGIRSPDSGMPNHAIHFRYGSSNTLVENNVITHCDRGIGFGLSDSTHTGGIIRNNMVHTTRDVGIGLERAANAKVYNNTVYTLNYSNSIEYRFPDTVGTVIVNNLTNQSITKRNDALATLAHNVTTARAAWFVDVSDGDLHLARPVDAILDQGQALPDVMADIDCDIRPEGGAYDIGADEFGTIFPGADNDEISDALDNCPNISNSEQEDSDDDDVGDACYAIAADSLLLVDFGGDASQNRYGLPGWNTVIKSTHTDYVTADGVSGNSMVSGTSRYDDYQGITGSVRNFTRGEQIVVTWYNATGSPLEITPLVTFEDADKPVKSSGEPQWHVMTTAKVPAHGYAETTYDIIDSYPITEVVSAGTHSVVNVSLNRADKQNALICDKIEIRTIDSISPTKPGNVEITNLTSSTITIQWSPSEDNVGVETYLVYANDNIVGETSQTQYELTLLQPSTSYEVMVQAMDAKRNKSEFSVSITGETFSLANSTLIDPSTDFEYKGAFKLPGPSGCSTSECEWSYGSGHGLAFNPNGDPDNTDGYPGSLYGLGKTKYASEISIPEPIISANPAELNTATTLKPFTKIFYENEAYNDEAVGGLVYLPPQGSQTRAKLYYTRGHQHKESGSGLEKPVTHGLAHADLANPIIDASWYIGPQGSKPNYFSYHSIMFNIPGAWANANGIPGYLLASSGFRSGAAPNGPGIIAISPWKDQNPHPGMHAELSFRTLLEYEYDASKSIDGSHIADRWEGGAWLRTESKAAVALGVKKAYGEYWYGMPEGPEANIHDVPFLPGSAYKGWHASRKSGLVVLYDPNDLAEVVAGTKLPYEPQPYAAWDISSYLYNVGNIRAMDFDPSNGYLYVFERSVNGSQGVIHVFKVGEGGNESPPNKAQTHQLTVSLAGNGYGQVSSNPSGIDCGEGCTESAVDYEEGTQIQLIATPLTGSSFAGWSGACDGLNSCTVTMDEAKEVLATFEATSALTYTLNAKAKEGGTITPSGKTSVDAGTHQTFTITPNAGYKIRKVLVDGFSQGAISTYTFSNVQADHNIVARFKEITYKLTGKTGYGGSMIPSGRIRVRLGKDQTFTIIPDPGYQIKIVKVDGVSQGVPDTYTFSDVQADHKIVARFKPATSAAPLSQDSSGNFFEKLGDFMGDSLLREIMKGLNSNAYVDIIQAIETGEMDGLLAGWGGGVDGAAGYLAGLDMNSLDSISEIILGMNESEWSFDGGQWKREFVRLETDLYEPVPEPGTLLLVGSGLLIMVSYSRKEFKRS